MTAVIARPAHAGSQLRLARGHLPHSRGLQSETRVAGGAGQTHETCLSDDAGRAGTCEDGRAAGELGGAPLTQARDLQWRSRGRGAPAGFVTGTVGEALVARMGAHIVAPPHQQQRRRRRRVRDRNRGKPAVRCAVHNDRSRGEWTSGEPAAGSAVGAAARTRKRNRAA